MKNFRMFGLPPEALSVKLDQQEDNNTTGDLIEIGWFIVKKCFELDLMIK